MCMEQQGNLSHSSSQGMSVGMAGSSSEEDITCYLSAFHPQGNPVSGSQQHFSLRQGVCWVAECG